eukprot:g1153.t1
MKSSFPIESQSISFIERVLYSRWRPKMVLLKDFLSSSDFSRIAFHGSILVGGCLLFFAGYYLGTRTFYRRFEVDCKVVEEQTGGGDVGVGSEASPEPKLERSTSVSSIGTTTTEDPMPLNDAYRLALIVRKDCGLRRGQTIIHCCRAFLAEFKKLYRDRSGDLKEWERDGQTLVVLRATNEADLLSIRNKSKKLGVVSHFYSEKQSDGSSLKTVLALGPAQSIIVRELTQHLCRL